MIIAIDFDGTIVEHEYPLIGKEKPLAGDIIRKLHSAGNTIIIWTCRGGNDLLTAKFFLDANKIPYDRLNENAHIDKIGFKPFPKIYADIYIDDRNLGGFPGWYEVERILL